MGLYPTGSSNLPLSATSHVDLNKVLTHYSRGLYALSMRKPGRRAELVCEGKAKDEGRRAEDGSPASAIERVTKMCSRLGWGGE